MLDRKEHFMQIQYEKAAIKYLKGLQKPQRNLILDAIEKLTHKPAEGDIKKNEWI